MPQNFQILSGQSNCICFQGLPTGNYIFAVPQCEEGGQIIKNLSANGAACILLTAAETASLCDSSTYVVSIEEGQPFIEGKITRI